MRTASNGNPIQFAGSRLVRLHIPRRIDTCKHDHPAFHRFSLFVSEMPQENSDVTTGLCPYSHRPDACRQIAFIPKGGTNFRAEQDTLG